MRGRMPEARPIVIPDTRPPMAPATARTDPFQLLVAEHALLLRQLASARRIAASSGAKARLGDDLARFAQAFRIHQRREEAALYPVCERLFSGPDGVARVLRDDHAGIVRDFAALQHAASGASARDLDRFIERVERHFRREEHVLFPLMAAMLPGTEASALARRLRGVASD